MSERMKIDAVWPVLLLWLCVSVALAGLPVAYLTTGASWLFFVYLGVLVLSIYGFATNVARINEFCYL